MQRFIICLRFLLLISIAINLRNGDAFGQNYERVNFSSNVHVLMEYEAKNTLSEEKMRQRTQILYQKRADEDTAALEAPKNLYYDVNLFSLGGGRARNDYFLDFDLLLAVALGFGRVPLLFGFKLIEFQTLLPWGSQTMGTHSVGARYIWGMEENRIHRYVYVDFNWGSYSKQEELENSGEQDDKEYGCWYFDLGLGAILQTGYFEAEVPTIGSVEFNGLEARLGWRIGDMERDVDNPMFGIYASAKFRLGWSGVKRLK